MKNYNNFYALLYFLLSLSLISIVNCFIETNQTIFYAIMLNLTGCIYISTSFTKKPIGNICVLFCCLLFGLTLAIFMIDLNNPMWILSLKGINILDFRYYYFHSMKIIYSAMYSASAILAIIILVFKKVERKIKEESEKTSQTI